MRTRGARGETLAEVLVSTTLLGIIGVGIIGAIATVLISSDVDRQTSQAETVLRSYVAAIHDAPYTPCADADAYSPNSVEYDQPAKFDAAVTTVGYWTGAGTPGATTGTLPVDFAPGCSTDEGLQRLELIVRSTAGRATERATIFKREVAVEP